MQGPVGSHRYCAKNGDKDEGFSGSRRSPKPLSFTVQVVSRAARCVSIASDIYASGIV